MKSLSNDTPTNIINYIHRCRVTDEYMTHMFVSYMSPMNILGTWPCPTPRTCVPYVPRLIN
jgi:hypothetical protein